MELIEKNYKHKDINKMNAECEDLISYFAGRYEALTEECMDIVLDHSNQKDKEWTELYNNPLDWLESILIKRERDCLEEVIDKLEDTVYTEKPKTTKRMKRKDSLFWFVQEVKPVIIEDKKTQRKEIAEHFNISEKTVRDRLTRAYGISWNEYRDGVLNGDF